MAKKCNHCKTVVEDKVSICPKCDNLAFTDLPKAELTYEQKLELEKNIAEKLSKSSRLAWQLTWRVALVIFTILGIPGAIVGWSIWSSMQSFKQTAANTIEKQFEILSENSSNQIAIAHSAISGEVNSNFANFQQEAQIRIASAYAAVTNQIAAEFETPRIKQTVEIVAKGEAKSILEEEVQPAVRNFKNDAAFIRTLAQAQAYDFEAYQRLLKVGSETNKNTWLANLVIAEVDRSLSRDRSQFSDRRTFETFSGTNFYTGPFTSDELAVYFPRAERDTTIFNREGFVNTVGDLKQPLFLPELIEFFTNETDLGVADRLTIAISAITKKDFHPHDFEDIQKWWHLHQNAYTNWPTGEFAEGLSNFFKADYNQSLKSFEKVLTIDPTADQSRALAIASCIQLGDTNRATVFAKDFKNHEGRWAKWGKATIELYTGSISNATVQFADLSKDQPTMVLLPEEGAGAWSKIDWQLFHKLTSDKKH